MRHKVFPNDFGSDECREKALGDYCDGVPPLPIPNREVKLISADGTVQTGE